LSATTSRRVQASPSGGAPGADPEGGDTRPVCPRWCPLVADGRWSAGRATTTAASDVRSGPVTEAGLLPDLNAPRWNTGAAWRWERTNERRPEVAGATSVLHKCSGDQACTMRRVARSRRQAHENRVLTQTTALSLIAACSAWMPGAARAGNAGREAGTSLLIRPWPVDILYRQVYSAIPPTTYGASTGCGAAAASSPHHRCAPATS